MEMMHFHFVKTVTRGIRKKKTKPYNNKMFGHKTTEPKTKMTVRTEVSFKPRSRTWHCLYLQNISICLSNMEFLSPTIVYAIPSLTSAIKKLSINIPCKFTSLYSCINWVFHYLSSLSCILSSIQVLDNRSKSADCNITEYTVTFAALATETFMAILHSTENVQTTSYMCLFAQWWLSVWYIHKNSFN
jgi:hypothetical protein